MKQKGINIVLADIKLPKIEMPVIISSSDIDNLMKNIDKIRGFQTLIRSDIKSLSDTVDKLTVAVIVLAGVVVIAIVATLLIFLMQVSKRKNKLTKNRDISGFIEKKAYKRVEELFKDVAFEESPDIVQLNKGMAELFYSAFQLYFCGLNSPQLQVAIVSEICERNKSFCEGVLLLDDSVYTELRSTIESIGEAAKSESPFEIQSVLHSRISNSIYDNLVEQKNILQHILKWMEDSKSIIEYVR